jgi:hypothetical protein
MLKKLVSIVIVLALAGSASALVISDTVTWGERTKIQDQSDGGVEVTGTGKLIANARVDHDGPAWLIIRTGGVVEFNDQYKLPDDDQGAENTPKIYIESGGLMTVADTESIGERLYADGGLYVDACGTFVTGNIGDGDRRDPRSGEWQIFPWGDADGYDITVEGNVATVHGTPEPATIMLLGLGGLALIRRRK